MVAFPFKLLLRLKVRYLGQELEMQVRGHPGVRLTLTRVRLKNPFGESDQILNASVAARDQQTWSQIKVLDTG